MLSCGYSICVCLEKNSMEELVAFTKAEGIEKSYYPNGNIKSEIEYKNEKENGLVKYYYKNGILIETARRRKYK